MLAEVVEVFYNGTTVDDISYPVGTVRAVLVPGNSPINIFLEIYAKPAGSIKRIPLVGEFINVFQAPSYLSTLVRDNSSYYYSDVININDSPNLNSKPLTYIKTVESSGTKTADYRFSVGNPKVTGVSDTKVPEPGKDFKSTNTSYLPPYEGDTIIEGRFGNTIRMGGTFGATTTERYNARPTWSGKGSGSPITILSNGGSVEDPNSNISTLFLSSDQKFTTFAGAQRRLALGVLPLQTFNKNQIILGSERIVLNSSTDSIILNASKTVSISTPNWAADMDTMFTQLDALVIQVTTLVSAISTALPPVGAALAPITVQLGTITAQLQTMKQT